ncbi:MAG: glycosyltransferase [Bacteroidales bacterium]|nr:glycosyltransferase [Bacteroidales bacterium]
MALFRKINWTVRHFLQDHFPLCFVDKDWLKWKGYKVDWDNPRDINEKIQCLMCRSDTSMWVLCADKYRVREYVESKGLGEMLIPLLGVWNNAEDIDFDLLPDMFSIKCNHDSGSTHLIDKSSGFDPDALRSSLARDLKKKFGYYNGELYYNRIKPLVIAEEWLELDDDSVSSTIIDYKVWCFDGKPYCILTCSDRSRETLTLNVYDLDWNLRQGVLRPTEHYRDGKGQIPRPEGLDRILEAASILSSGFPEVRVDFYSSGGKVYFGEMTFSSLGGRMNYFTDDFLVELGRQCVLPVKG